MRLRLWLRRWAYRETGRGARLGRGGRRGLWISGQGFGCRFESCSCQFLVGTPGIVNCALLRAGILRLRLIFALWREDQSPAQDDNFSEFSSSVPADRLLVQIDVDLLGFEVFFDTPGAEFAAETGLFIAAPRGLHVRWLHVIYPDNSGAQGFDGAQGFENIAGPNGGGEAVRRIVGD